MKHETLGIFGATFLHPATLSLNVRNDWHILLNTPSCCRDRSDMASAKGCGTTGVQPALCPVHCRMATSCHSFEFILHEVHLWPQEEGGHFV